MAETENPHIPAGAGNPGIPPAAGNCRILAKGRYRDSDTRATGLNNNDLVIGPSGAGKTRGYVIPNILQCRGSLIVTDTKGTIRGQVEGILEREGYRVLELDFTDCAASCGYNPFDYIRRTANGKYREQDVVSVASAIIPLETRHDPIWELCARTYLEALMGYVLECLPPEEQHMGSVITLFNEMRAGSYDWLMEELGGLDPESFAYTRYRMNRSTREAEKMYESILAFLYVRLSAMSFDGARHMLTTPDRVCLERLGLEKTALFVTISDTDRSMDYLANLFYTQALQALCALADETPGGRLEMPVRFILDDFAANVAIPDFDRTISVIRSREVSASIILQSVTQLEALYGSARAATILNNCDTCLYLGGQDVGTARYIAEKADRTPASILGMPLDQAWLFTRGRSPELVERYDLREHPRYRELPEYGGPGKEREKQKGGSDNGHTENTEKSRSTGDTGKETGC